MYLQTAQTTIPGGLSEEKAATPEIQKICDQMRAEVEKKLQQSLNDFTAKSYKTQVVAGVIYYVKVGFSIYIYRRSITPKS